jgi:hypothetical protein
VALEVRDSTAQASHRMSTTMSVVSGSIVIHRVIRYRGTQIEDHDFVGGECRYRGCLDGVRMYVRLQGVGANV